MSFARELARWYFGPAEAQGIAVTGRLDDLRGPVLLCHDPKLETPAIAGIRRVRDGLQRRGQAVEMLELPRDHASSPASARSTMHAVIAFLGKHLARQDEARDALPPRP